MKRQRIVDIIQEDASSIEVMTECLNQFNRFDLLNATEDEKNSLYMAVRRFVGLVRAQPFPERT